jgi:hypothetical protein
MTRTDGRLKTCISRPRKPCCRDRPKHTSGMPYPLKANQVMQAMLQMVKIDIEGLRRAYEQS